MFKYNKLYAAIALSAFAVGCSSDSNDSSDKDTPPVVTEDTTAPVITITGEKTITLNVGDTYEEPGATVVDNVDENPTLVISGNVDTSTAGEYTITYTATDAAGNTATSTRKVIVQALVVEDTTAPLITLVGNSSVSLYIGETYEELGAKAIDNVDGDVTVTISGNVDTSKLGEYIITYTATDTAGNTATLTRTVTVKEALAPVEGDTYIFHSQFDASFADVVAEDTWANGSTFSVVNDNEEYGRVLQVNSGTAWGTAATVGWKFGDSAFAANDYTHITLKVKSDKIANVLVYIGSDDSESHGSGLPLASGSDLGNGWMELLIPINQFASINEVGIQLLDSPEATSILLTDIILQKKERASSLPLGVAPTSPNADQDLVTALYSDTYTIDHSVETWHKDWSNAPLFSEGEIAGDKHLRYEIQGLIPHHNAVGIILNGPDGELDASRNLNMNFDLFVEEGVDKVHLELISATGTGQYHLNTPETGVWTSHRVAFDDLNVPAGLLTTSGLREIGLFVGGKTGSAIFIDNFYFDGEAAFNDLTLTVIDNHGDPVEGAQVIVGSIIELTDANGVAVLSLPAGVQSYVVKADGHGDARGEQDLTSGDATASVTINAFNPGPQTAAPVPSIDDAAAITLYSDTLTLDGNIHNFAADWWNGPIHSDEQIDGNNMLRYQLTEVGGTQGGIVGLEYDVLDASSATGITMDVFLTSGITAVNFEVISQSGGGRIELVGPTTGEWIKIDVDFADLVGKPDGFNPAAMHQLGIKGWGSTSDSVYIDNIYFR